MIRSIMLLKSFLKDFVNELPEKSDTIVGEKDPIFLEVKNKG